MTLSIDSKSRIGFLFMKYYLLFNIPMDGIKIAAFAFILCRFQISIIQCQDCEKLPNFSGKIVANSDFSAMEECWFIPVSQNHYIHLKLNSLISSAFCRDGYVRIIVAGTGDEYEFCSSDKSKNPITAFGDVTVTYVAEYLVTSSSFELEYSIKSLECISKNSFKCYANSCIPEEEVCDGVKDCKNGADEIGCETGVLSIEGVSEARGKAVSWLKQKRTAVWGWRENTPRAVVALYLAAAATFNGSVLDEELMVKQNEIKTSVALLRPSLTNSEISMLINALLVTCHNPRQFYGNDLVKRLKDQVGEDSGSFTHPLAYLTLCNANESWPLKARSDLNSILSTDSEYPFVKDLQAMAIMALSCKANRSRNINYTDKNTTLSLYKETIQHFIKLQATDGSFGNVYTTALITQALLSSGQEQNSDWKLNATIKYLVKEINSPSANFLMVYLTLPVLNGKSLVDISNVNCSANQRKLENDSVSEVSEYLGPKIRVQYSLYVGDEKDVIHTISLRVPENYKASEVMKLAEIEDPKYKFEWKTTSAKMYVYEIGGLTNDPEAGKFWLLYVGSADGTKPLVHLTNGPDRIVMAEGEHLVLWYRTATI